MKICAIGNSHLAAFKLGWDDISGRWGKNIDIVFFGSAGNFFSRSVAIENNCLIPKTDKFSKDFCNTSGGLDKVNFADYDAILLIGLDCNIWTLTHPLSNHCTIDSLPAIEDKAHRIISTGCLTQVGIDQIAQCSMFQVASLIRTVSSIPIFIAPVPFPSISGFYSPSLICTYLARNANQTLQDCYYQAIAHLCDIHEVTFIAQPDSTITDYVYTKEIYSKGSVKLGHNLTTLHDETDFAHMNKEYGTVVLQAVLENILDTL